MRIVPIALCGLALLQAQQAAQPTFKSATELVEVDAVVLDRNGNFVPGLKAADVTLYENGKPQKIQQFFMVTHDLGVTEGSIRSEYAGTPQPTSRKPLASRACWAARRSRSRESRRGATSDWPMPAPPRA